MSFFSGFLGRSHDGVESPTCDKTSNTENIPPSTEPSTIKKIFQGLVGRSNDVEAIPEDEFTGETITGAIGAVGAGMQSAGEAAVEGIKDAGSAVASGVKKVGKNISEGAQSAKDTIVERTADLKEGVAHIGTDVKESAEDIGEALKEKATELKHGADRMSQDIADRAAQARDAAKEKAAELKHGADRIGQDITDKAAQARDAAKDKAADVKHGAEKMAYDVSNKAAQARDAAKEKAAELKHDADRIGKDMKASAGKYDPQMIGFHNAPGIEHTREVKDPVLDSSEPARGVADPLHQAVQEADHHKKVSPGPVSEQLMASQTARLIGESTAPELASKEPIHRTDDPLLKQSELNKRAEGLDRSETLEEIKCKVDSDPLLRRHLLNYLNQHYPS